MNPKQKNPRILSSGSKSGRWRPYGSGFRLKTLNCEVQEIKHRAVIWQLHPPSLESPSRPQVTIASKLPPVHCPTAHLWNDTTMKVTMLTLSPHEPETSIKITSICSNGSPNMEMAGRLTCPNISALRGLIFPQSPKHTGLIRPVTNITQVCSVIYAELMQSGLHSTQYSKRELSPDTPPTSHKRVTKHTSPRLAKLHRRLATVKPYRPMSPEGKPAVREEWNTLNPVEARTSDETHKKVKSSGPFRLPSQAFQANQSSRSSNKVPSSTHSSRANWFRPAPISSQSSSSNNRPVFVTEAKAVSEQEGFHNQLKASIGLQGQARDYLQESTHPRRYPASPLTSSQTRFEPEPEEDWREAWSRKTASRQSNSSLSRFAYDQSSQLQEQSL